jgi:Organic solute transporter Ostalpha
MTPIAELYEIFALVSVFFLLIAYLVPQPNWQNQLAFFSQPENGGYITFRKTYMMVMQALPGRIITTIALEIVTAVNCVGSKDYRRAQTIISIINGIQVALALVALLKFLMRFRSKLQAVDSKVVGKLFTFKLIVALQFVQKIIFNILTQTKVLSPTRTMSYNDLNLGLNSFLTCLEVGVISVVMIYFYNPRLHGRSADFVVSGEPGMLSGADGEAMEEGVGRKVVNPKMSVFRAVWDAVDMVDVVKGIGRAVILFRQR